MEPNGSDMQTHIEGFDSRPHQLQNNGHLMLPGRGVEMHCQKRATNIKRHKELNGQGESQNSIPEPKRRKKDQVDCCLEPLANFPEEGAEEILKDGNTWKKYQEGWTEGLNIPCFSYKCTHPGCSMRMHTEGVSLHPDKMMVSYEGRHNHSNIPSSPRENPVQPASQEPSSNQEDIVERQQFPLVDNLNLDQYIEQLKPNYGIFLTCPSKIKFGILDDYLPQAAGEIISREQTFMEPQYIDGLMQNQQVEENHIGGYSAFKPITYEKPSFSLVVGGGCNAEQVQLIQPFNAQPHGSWSENQNAQASIYLSPNDEGYGNVQQCVASQQNQGGGWSIGCDI